MKLNIPAIIAFAGLAQAAVISELEPRQQVGEIVAAVPNFNLEGFNVRWAAGQNGNPSEVTITFNLNGKECSATRKGDSLYDGASQPYQSIPTFQVTACQKPNDDTSWFTTRQIDGSIQIDASKKNGLKGATTLKPETLQIKSGFEQYTGSNNVILYGPRL